MTPEELLQKAKEFNSLEEYEEVLELLQDNILRKHSNADLYAEKALALFRLKKIELCYETTEQALQISPNNAKANHYKGNLFLDAGEYKNAEIYFKKAIKLSKNYSSPYNGLGIVYNDLKDFKNAIKNYKKAIEIDRNIAIYHDNLGIAYSLSHYEKSAIRCFNKAIKLNPDFIYSYYNLGLSHFNLKEYGKSLHYFKKYISLTTNNPDYFTKLAESKIKEIRKHENLPDDIEFNRISDLVNKIKLKLLVKERCITHYTSLTVAKLLILEGKIFRLSEGAFLNDTSEGRELFRFLNLNYATETDIEIDSVLFAQKPFIGSFVDESKHNDLTLWRMYGKENMEEAKGCSITIKMEQFLEDIKNKIHPTNNTDASKLKGDEFRFYKVAYRKNGSRHKFLINDANETELIDFNILMDELSENVKNYILKRKRKDSDTQNLIELLNEIAYLFKSAEYQHENELRLVVNGEGFDKVIDYNSNPSRVYIELVSIRPIIRRITLGPKVERADEWAAAFNYSLDQKKYDIIAENFKPEINISKLPFK